MGKFSDRTSIFVGFQCRIFVGFQSCALCVLLDFCFSEPIIVNDLNSICFKFRFGSPIEFPAPEALSLCWCNVWC